MPDLHKSCTMVALSDLLKDTLDRSTAQVRDPENEYIGRVMHPLWQRAVGEAEPGGFNFFEQLANLAGAREAISDISMGYAILRILAWANENPMQVELMLHDARMDMELRRSFAREFQTMLTHVAEHHAHCRDQFA